MRSMESRSQRSERLCRLERFEAKYEYDDLMLNKVVAPNSITFNLVVKYHFWNNAMGVR